MDAGKMDAARVGVKLEPPKRSKLALAIFWGGAACLAPWIVALYLTQKPTGHGYHLRGVSVGISLCLLLGMLMTARLAARRSKMVILWAAFCGTLAFITAWFGSSSTQGAAFWVLLVYAIVVLLPVSALSFWVVARAYGDRAAGALLPRWVRLVFTVGAATVIVPIVIGLVGVPPVHAAVHLRLVWTGLDCFELAFMIASGVCVWRRSSAVAITAMCLGTLMFADAWYNIFATTGAAVIAALAMALGELPLSGYSVYTAHHEVQRWPSADASMIASSGQVTSVPSPG